MKAFFVLWILLLRKFPKPPFKLRSKKNLFAIAFYNLENFFDTKNDLHVLDDDFTPNGSKKWDDDKYKKKVKKLAKTISCIGYEESGMPPVLVGIAEVENKNAINALVNSKGLKKHNYAFVHFDSPDERGIDTALLYHKQHFKVINAETIPLIIKNINGDRDFTRDILYVHGKLHKEEIHVFVNHWPSRRDGQNVTSYKRVRAAATVLQKINSLKNENLNCVIMGDFNDDPNSESIKTLMATGNFINPLQKLFSPNTGSANYRGKWNLFDQILISHSFLSHEKESHSFMKTDIFAPKFLREWKKKYKGFPFRTFVGKKYLGGYSDHFPVYIILKQN